MVTVQIQTQVHQLQDNQMYNPVLRLSQIAEDRLQAKKMYLTMKLGEGNKQIPISESYSYDVHRNKIITGHMWGGKTRKARMLMQSKKIGV